MNDIGKILELKIKYVNEIKRQWKQSDKVSERGLSVSMDDLIFETAVEECMDTDKPFDNIHTIASKYRIDGNALHERIMECHDAMNEYL